MRRFLITGKFAGKVEVHYNADGILRRLDFAAAELTPDAIKWFKARTAVNVENIHAGFETHVTITEEDFEVTFDEWIREYGYKRNTHLAREYWPKVPLSKHYTAFAEAIEYRKYCERNKHWYKPMLPEKWLKTQQYLNNWKEL